MCSQSSPSRRQGFARFLGSFVPPTNPAETAVVELPRFIEPPFFQFHGCSSGKSIHACESNTQLRLATCFDSVSVMFGNILKFRTKVPAATSAAHMVTHCGNSSRDSLHSKTRRIRVPLPQQCPRQQKTHLPGTCATKSSTSVVNKKRPAKLRMPVI